MRRTAPGDTRTLLFRDEPREEANHVRGLFADGANPLRREGEAVLWEVGR